MAGKFHETLLAVLLGSCFAAAAALAATSLEIPATTRKEAEVPLSKDNKIDDELANFSARNDGMPVGRAYETRERGGTRAVRQIDPPLPPPPHEMQEVREVRRATAKPHASHAAKPVSARKVVAKREKKQKKHH